MKAVEHVIVPPPHTPLPKPEARSENFDPKKKATETSESSENTVCINHDDVAAMLASLEQALLRWFMA